MPVLAPPPGGIAAGITVELLSGLGALAPVDAAEAFRDLPGLALLESARPGRRARWSFLTADPLAVIERPDPQGDPFETARRMLHRLERRAVEEDDAPPFTGGLVGYLGYDLGRRLEPLPSIAASDQPLPAMRLALHDWTLAWDRATGNAWLATRAVDGDDRGRDERRRDVLARVGTARARATRHERRSPTAFRSNLGRRDWAVRVAELRAAIAAGEIYQANLARRLEAPFWGDTWPLYRRLRTGDPATFQAYVDLGARRALLSASPEPFLRLDRRRRVGADPIKGTRARGETPEQDRRLAQDLLDSAKDRAENTMIVDVLRNDLGRVCSAASVSVPRLCRLERTATVQHLVSTVEGELAPGRDAFDLIAAAFPGGSITGAPKLRAMELIETIEPVRRGPYTGAALWIGADGAMGSSILIRTFVADGERLTLHVGGGITWRSDAAEEWDETRAKAAGPLRAIGASEISAE